MSTAQRALRTVHSPEHDTSYISTSTRSISKSAHELIVLYDIPPAKGARTWSPNVWRARLALNYKDIPYRTEWVEYPDIENLGKKIGAKPTGSKPDGSGDPFWTCPMIIDPNHLDLQGKPIVLADSYTIARYLDEVYPERKLFPEGTLALQNAWAQFVAQSIRGPLVRLLVPLCADALPPRSREYFIATREAWYQPLKEMCPDRSKAWKELKLGLDKVAAALDLNGIEEGRNLRVIPGHWSYADFAHLAPLLYTLALASEEEIERLKSWKNGRWSKILSLDEQLLSMH